MTISPYADGMTLRNIEYHRAATIGTAISRETPPKIVGEVRDEVPAWQRRALEVIYPSSSAKQLVWPGDASLLAAGSNPDEIILSAPSAGRTRQNWLT